MMAEQKGRGGKKPKYQIADIGGSDLTAQDLSTERVLNFLIKGEIGSAEQGADIEGNEISPVSSSQGAPPTGRSEKTPMPSLPSSETQGKKSLAHLFQRANVGDGAVKDQKLDLRANETIAQTPSAGEVTKTERAQPAPANIQAESVVELISQPAEPITKIEPATPVIRAATQIRQLEAAPEIADSNKTTTEHSTPTTAISENAELTQLVTLWRSFYRLKDGEIDTLRTLYHISYGQGSPECYMKMHKLAEMSNLTYRYCQKVVRSLEQLGWITKLEDYNPSTRLGVLYRVNLKPSI